MLSLFCTENIDLNIQKFYSDWNGSLELSSVPGGDINQAYLISDGQKSFFLKLNQKHFSAMFDAEFCGLEAIAGTQTITVPRPFAVFEDATHSYLLLEFIPLKSSATAEEQLALGQALAGLHLSPADKFGFASDNFIGSTPQPNGWSFDWIEFFRQQRLQYQFQLLAKTYNLKSAAPLMNTLLRNLDYYFDGYSPKPALIHGDLWSGNWAFHRHSGEPVIYDPAAYYADHEMELAMMELFGSPGKAFFDGYQSLYPIDSGYKQRRLLYQLYHILNHANLFGGHYVEQSCRMIRTLATNIK